MSDLPAPTELGQELFLKTGLDVGPSKVISSDDLGQVVWTLRKLAETSELARMTYYMEFGAIYLPSLLRTYFGNPYDLAEPEILSWTALNQIMPQVIGYIAFNMVPSFTRFIREHPDEALSFYPLLVDRVVLYRNHDEKDLPVHLAITLRHFIWSLFITLPPTTPIPELPALTQDRIGVIGMRLSGLQDTPQINGAQVFKEAYLILHLLGSPDPRAKFLETFRPEKRGGIRIETWWRCEATGIPQSHRGTKEPIGECAKGEMMVCSRCLGMRYCSKVHQKVDWYRHKQMCFVPKW